MNTAFRPIVFRPIGSLEQMAALTRCGGCYAVVLADDISHHVAAVHPGAVGEMSPA